MAYAAAGWLAVRALAALVLLAPCLILMPSSVRGSADPGCRLVAESRATEDEVTAKGVPNDLPLDTPMNLKQVRCHASLALHNTAAADACHPSSNCLKILPCLSPTLSACCHTDVSRHHLTCQHSHDACLRACCLPACSLTR